MIVEHVEELANVEPQPCTTYRWYEYLLIDNEWRYIVPRADPNLFEFAIDFEFDTYKGAIDFLGEWEIDPEEWKDWVLCREHTEPLGRATEYIKEEEDE